MYGLNAAALGLVAALLAPANAYFRMACPGRIVTERADPVIYPGAVSPHVHTVSGGNGFSFSMTYDDARASDCSSCPIKQDLSNYWTPKLYYQYENGSFQDVAQSGDGNGVYGGMTVYYLQRPGPNNDPLYAFPEGFRMVAGNPYKRINTSDFASQAVSFVCLDYTDGSSTWTGLPTVNCPDGLRAQIFFPSCWDGVNLDSADHESHMSYPVGGTYDSGSCPSSHPVHLISIFFEVNYNTGDFSDMWYGSGQPFVFAMGDPTGYGFHGDFVNGWDVDVLQTAINECTSDSGLVTDCSIFELFTTAESQACLVPPQVDEQVTGILDALPGCNPVQYGPGNATQATGCGATTSIGAFEQYYTDLTSSLGWYYAGCGTDDGSSRTLSSASESTNSMTPAACVKYCSGLGYSIAGLEYSSQCYCGNSVPADRAPIPGYLGNCFSTCTGDANQFCGGSDALSLYVNCEGGSCVNNAYTGTVPNTTASALSAVSVKATSTKTSSTSSSSSSSTTAAVATTLAKVATSAAASVSTTTTKTSTSTSGIPSASLCPAANATQITDSNGNQYTVTCSVDTNWGSYTSTQASTSYLDCMTACDAASSAGCTAFTYVGGANGSGAGTCWLKTGFNSNKAAANNYISAIKVTKTSRAKARMAAAEAAHAESKREAEAVEARLAEAKSKRHVRAHINNAHRY